MKVLCRTCPATYSRLGQISSHSKKKAHRLICCHNFTSDQEFSTRESLISHLLSAPEHAGEQSDWDTIDRRGPPQPNNSYYNTAQAAGPLLDESHLTPLNWTKIQSGHHENILYALTRLTSSGSPTKPRKAAKEGFPQHGWPYAPTPSKINPKRAAVALDCEMINAIDGNDFITTLARLTVIDFLTSEVLIDSLVKPRVQRIVSYIPWLSGITEDMMRTAIDTGVALDGVQGAQAELFNYIDTDTIIVGHALQNDLSALRIKHSRFVDSNDVATSFIGPPANSIGLETVCREICGIQIRQVREGAFGHCSLEDSFAAREVILRCMDSKERVRLRAEPRRERAEAKRVERAERRKIKEELKAEERLKGIQYQREELQELGSEQRDHEAQHILSTAGSRKRKRKEKREENQKRKRAEIERAEAESCNHRAAWKSANLYALEIYKRLERKENNRRERERLAKGAEECGPGESWSTRS